MREGTKEILQYIRSFINKKTNIEIGEDLNISSDRVGLFIWYYKIERTTYVYKKRRASVIIVMDYDLNIIKECESMKSMCREFANNENNLSVRPLELLREGYVIKFYGKLIIKKEFYNKNNDFKYTYPSREVCSKLRSVTQQNKCIVIKNTYNRRIAILNDDYTIREVIMCSMEDLGDRFNVSKGTIKSNLHKAPEVLYNMAIVKSRRIRRVLYIHMKNYNQLIERITKYKNAHEKALDVFSKIN